MLIMAFPISNRKACKHPPNSIAEEESGIIATSTNTVSNTYICVIYILYTYKYIFFSLSYFQTS